MFLLSSVLAHAGGWDEALIFGIPIITVLLWVRFAEKRARERRDAAAGGAEAPDGPGPETKIADHPDT